MTAGAMGAEPESDLPRAPAGPRKVCLVCGDRALGYNFNVISCESCKAFFRRNALAGKEFKCPFANACDITVVTRRFCQRCRLEKCLAVGMIKEFIMSEEDKARKREKIEENRAKKRSARDDAVTSSRDEDSDSKSARRMDSVQCEALSTTSGPPELSPPSSCASESYAGPYIPYESYEYGSHPVHAQIPTTSDQKPLLLQSDLPVEDDPDTAPDSIRAILTEEKFLAGFEGSHAVVTPELQPHPSEVHDTNDILHDTHRAIVPEEKCLAGFAGGHDVVAHESHPHPLEADDTNDILHEIHRIEPSSMESILCEAIKLEFQSVAGLSTGGSGSRQLNEVELAKMDELVVANRALNAPIDDDLSQLTAAAPTTTTHDPELITIINLTAVAIRRLIKMAKKISAFRNLCEEDQVALLKGGCIEMMVLRSTLTYDGQKNTWQLPHSQERFGTIRTDVLKKAKGNIYQAHEHFISTFEPRWCQDERLILVLSAILLFTPTRPRVVHIDVVRLEQNAYYYLLRRYLESEYPGCEAKANFLKLIEKVRELRRLAEEVTGVYLDVNPLEPLLIEIFDLKQRAP